MYIHGYQIHNVLNVYRKQLSQPVGNAKPKEGSPAVNRERINISKDGQRQSVFDKISMDIVDRITRFEAATPFESVLKASMSPQPSPADITPEPKESAFSYNVIDADNRKTTNTLPLQRLNPISQTPSPDIDGTVNQKDEKE